MPSTLVTPAAPSVNIDDLQVVTLIQSHVPATVGKRYELRDGELVKHQVSNISRGEARSYDASTAELLRDLLAFAAEQPDYVVCPALWHGDLDGTPFNVVTEAALARLAGETVGAPELGGVHELDGVRVAARLRRGLWPSVWLLLDLDNPPGTPAEWRTLGMAERIARFACLLPGLDTCERIELRGSSSRVVPQGGRPGGATHAYVRVSDPFMISTLKAHVSVEMVLAGLSFRSPRFSRLDGSVVGHAHRTLFDLAVWDAGRLIFCAQPVLSADMLSAGWTVADADVRIVNPGGGALDVSGYALPDETRLSHYATETGERLTYAREGESLSVRSAGMLTLDSPIESRGRSRPLRDWLAGMRDGATLRCEAPFRASVSEAAFIRRTGADAGYVHDVGCATTYTLDTAAVRQEATAALGARLAEMAGPAAVEAVIASGEPRRASEAALTEVGAATAHRDPVICTEGLEHIVRDRMAAELPRLPTPVFRHAGGLVHVSRSREIRTYDADGHGTVTRAIGMERVGKAWLACELSRNLAFVKPNARGGRQVDVPKLPVQMLMEGPMDTVPFISGIISTPTMRPDGTILSAAGFDVETGFWLDHTLEIAVPETPTKEQANEAYSVLCELLAGFPMDALNEAVAVSAMLGAVLRPAFPSMPGLLIEAPVAGAGKSHLTKTIGYLAHGELPAVSTWPKGDEVKKQLNALLLSGTPFLAFDNANGADISGDEICLMLTEPTVKFRILGKAEDVSVRTAGLVLVINGNHPRISEDATQRFVTCYLLPTEANPRERDFTNDPLELLRLDRGRYVSACLTVGRAYIAAGRPGAVGYGSFMAWSRLIRSSIMWLTDIDILETTRATVADDPELQRIVDVAGLILSHVPLGETFTVAGLLSTISQRDAMQVQVLGGLLGAGLGGSGIASENAIKDKIGQFFRRKMRDRVFEANHAGRRVEITLVKQGIDRTQVARWALKLVRDIGPYIPTE